MTKDACFLDGDQRQLVESTIAEHCHTRDWTLFAVNCRSNHVHVVVASKKHPKTVRSELKAWCTQHLKEELQRQSGCYGRTDANPSFTLLASGDISEVIVRANWWAERSSAICIDHDKFLEDVIHYLHEGQDQPLERRR
jgi:REP element-mobilizing transposase RayT